MERIFDTLKLVFVAAFVIASAGSLIYHGLWVSPAVACEKERKWWDPKHRVCATPVLISDITGRTIEDKEAEAAAKAAIGRQ